MKTPIPDLKTAAHACLKAETCQLDLFIDLLVAMAEEDGELWCELSDQNTITFTFPGRKGIQVETTNARAKMRMICAAMFGLCKQKGTTEFDLSPYGCPQCRIPATKLVGSELVVSYANTTCDQFVRIRRPV